jgi:predicted MFS family arabinose efflux permease
MIDVSRSSGTEWRKNWTVVLAASVGFSFMSIMTPATGVFMAPLAKEFGWSRTELSAGITVAALIAVLASPFTGVLVDRIGSRRTALPGIFFTALAVAAFGSATGSFAQWLVLWAFWGVSSLFIQSNVWSAAVASLFVNGRGLALGLTLAGTAVAQVLIPPLTNALIGEFGWRAAFAYIALGWGAVAFLSSILFLYDARDQYRRSARKSGNNSPSAVVLPGLTVQQAWRNPDLWKIAISTVLLLMITVAISVHQFPILVEAGLTRENAAWMLSLFGIAAVVGKLVTGWLMDRFHGRWVGGITFTLVGIAYMLLLEPFRSPGLVLAAMILSGYAGGTKMQLCGYLTARYAGLRNYATIFGAMTSAIALASGVGPLLAGVIYDYSGSYTYLLVAGTVLPFISGLLLFRLRPYPRWKETGDCDPGATDPTVEAPVAIV